MHSVKIKLIGHICENLVKIKYFRHEYGRQLDTYENTQKNAIKSKGLPKLAVTSDILIHQNVRMD